PPKRCKNICAAGHTQYASGKKSKESSWPQPLPLRNALYGNHTGHVFDKLGVTFITDRAYAAGIDTKPLLRPNSHRAGTTTFYSGRLSLHIQGTNLTRARHIYHQIMHSAAE